MSIPLPSYHTVRKYSIKNLTIKNELIESKYWKDYNYYVFGYKTPWLLYEWLWFYQCVAWMKFYSFIDAVDLNVPSSKSKLYKYGTNITKIASELRKQLVTITKRTLFISVAKIDTINVKFWGFGYFKIDFRE